MTFKLLVLPGDGIGPEVTREARRVIDWFVARRGLEVEIEEDLLGGASHDRRGSFLTEATKARARAADGPATRRGGWAGGAAERGSARGRARTGW